jgi:esterase
VAEQADDAAGLLDALAALPAVVIGRSYGGAVAIDLALRNPDRVRALVLLEVTRSASRLRDWSGRGQSVIASARWLRITASTRSTRR